MTNSLRNFSIRFRMWGAIAMVLSLLCLVGGTGLWGLSRVSAASDGFVNGAYTHATLLDSVDSALADARRYEKDMLLNATDPAAIAKYRAKWVAVSERSLSETNALVAASTGDVAKAAERLLVPLKAYADKAKPAFAQLDGTPDSAIAATATIAKATVHAHEAEGVVSELNKLLQAVKDQYLAQSAATVRQSFWLSGLSLLLAVVLVAPLTLLNMHSICSPIDAARRLAERIATGDLSTPVTDSGADESARLLKALDAMQSNLRTIVGQVRQSAESIQVASAEVASGNTDLSQRTEQAASNLQQTAGSIEQLTSNVRQSADAAAQANQLASSASAVAQRGGQVVSEVVSTMNEINSSSKRIADIIGTIDGIAFQTNILALNAAVEAARAGEQGRGFAVVASEVRSLAQRSAEAAREIKTLIGTSVDKVETGARLVQDAGSTMNEIVASVQRVTDVIGEITAAAAEQSSGIAQVNGAIGSLDQMTQQNAALVEESAAAAESLRDQAQRLNGMVATFVLGDGQGHAQAPAPVTTYAVSAPRPPAPARAPAPRPVARAPAPAPEPALKATAEASSTEWESF